MALTDNMQRPFSDYLITQLALLVFAILMIAPGLTIAEATSAAARLRILPLSLSGSGPELKVWIFGKGGRQLLVLRPTKGFSVARAARPHSGQVLFSGRGLLAPAAAHGRLHDSPATAAASITDGKLSIYYPGRRRSRMISLEANLPKDWLGSYAGAISIEARVASISSHFSASCAASEPEHTALSLSARSQSEASVMPFSPPIYLDISADVDHSWQRRYGSRSYAKVVTILNAAQALYLEQLGIRLRLISRHTWPQSEKTFLTEDSVELLKGFRRLGEYGLRLVPADIYHLFSAITLDEHVIGISYVGATCYQNSYSYSLSTRVNESIQALVTAHEIGHNLGASHPEDSLPDEAPSLMTTVVRAENSRFSSFSLAQISGHLAVHNQENSCLAESPAPYVLIRSRFNRSSRRLSITASPISFPAGSQCSASLYAAGRSKQLRSRFLPAREPLVRRRFSSEAQRVILSRRIARHPGSRGVNVYGRLKIECSGGVSLLSAVRRTFISDIRSAARL